MSNLDDFKVEELEQRLEMRKWKATGSASGTLGCTGGDCNGSVTVGIGVTF